MVPIGAVAHLGQTVSPPLITLYNLYPSSTIVGGAGARLQLGPGDGGDGGDRQARPARRRRLRMDGDVLSGEDHRQPALLRLRACRCCSSISCLAGQYESWILPLAVLAAVPLALLGPVIALTSLGAANNLYTQIGLMLLIALSAKNGILIVEVAREQRMQGKSIWESAVEAARAPLPSDPDDVVRLHPRRPAAGARDRRRRQRAPLARHQRLFRHDRLDLPRRPVRAVVLRRAAALTRNGGRAKRSRRRRLRLPSPGRRPPPRTPRRRQLEGDATSSTGAKEARA